MEKISKDCDFVHDGGAIWHSFYYEKQNNYISVKIMGRIVFEA